MSPIPVPPAAEPPVGSAAGHGRYGTLDGDGDRLICHECGATYLNLGTHAWGAHQLTARAYRTRYGLSRATALIAAPVAAKLSTSASRPERLAHLADVRDPATARTKMTGTIAAQTRATRAATAAAGARHPTREQLARLGDPDTDKPAFTARAVAMIRDGGLSRAGISAAYGRSPAWLNQRIRRYRAPETQETD